METLKLILGRAALPHSLNIRAARQQRPNNRVTRSRRSLPFYHTLILMLFVCMTLHFSLTARGAGPSPIVPGLENHTDISPKLAGNVLIGELSCTACHAADNTQMIAKGGPDLSSAGSRVHHDHLRQFIADPHGTKPGTTMPDMLSHLSEEERNQTADAIANYLASLGGEPIIFKQPEPEAISRGKALYHSVGCVACHSPETPIAGSVPLGLLAEKYSLASLAAFLKDPLAVRLGGRMPDLHLNHNQAENIASYLLRDQSVGKRTFKPNTKLVAQGRKLFSENRCNACHKTSSDNVPTMATALTDLKPNRGCLSDVTGNWPRYSLSQEQQFAIRSQLEVDGVPLDSEEQIELTLTQFNCIACHQRSGYGGVSTVRDEFFTTLDPNLGEQGRLPPTLTGVGAKLKPEWLRRILVQGAPGRPYFHTRMPRFGSGPLDHLMDLLVEKDQLPKTAPIEVGNMNDMRRAGRDLAGTDGLSCVTCHTFKDQKTGAMAALDMTLMAQRVTRDWFHLYLAEPQRFNPNTIMPAFWFGDQAAKPDVLDGNPARQIEALWLYLLQAYGAGQPRGIHREPLRLVSTGGEAVMLRRSYRGIGKRGIGVGYPGGVNLVFNAERLGLAKVWRGEFVDPAGVWTSQGHGTARPLSRESIDFAESPEIAVIEQTDSPWPVIEGRPSEHRFKGYSLDSLRRPRFQYSYRDTDVEDYFVDYQNDDRFVLRRTLTFQSPKADAQLVFRAAVHKQVAVKGGNRFHVGTALEIFLPEETAAQIVDTSNGKELRVPISLTSGKASLILDYIF